MSLLPIHSIFFWRICLYMQFPISFPPFSLEPTEIRLLPWHPTNMAVINIISDIHALHLTWPFRSIWHNSLCFFLRFSFHLPFRTPYFLSFTFPYWLLPVSLLCCFPTTYHWSASNLVFGSLLHYSLGDVIQSHVCNIISMLTTSKIMLLA